MKFEKYNVDEFLKLVDYDGNFSFRALQNRLKNKGFKWPKSRKELIQQCKNLELSDFRRCQNEIALLYEDINMHGSKSVFLHEISSEEKDNLTSFLEKEYKEDNPYQEIWPFPIQFDKNGTNKEKVIANVKKHNDGISYTFCYPFDVLQRKKIVRNELSGEAVQHYDAMIEDYDDIYGYKNRTQQMYDVVSNLTKVLYLSKK